MIFGSLGQSESASTACDARMEFCLARRFLTLRILSQNLFHYLELYQSMNELLDNPAVQAGVVPFVVALVVAALLQRTRITGLAIGAGFAAVIVLAIGFSFEPLTAVRKMVLCGVGACLLLVAMELRAVAPSTRVRLALAAAAALAAVWVVLRVLVQKETGPALLAGLGAAAYLAALVDAGNHADADPLGLAASGLMMGLCAGALALLGASASMAQVGIAVGASSGAVLLVQMLTARRLPVGWTLALPASVLAGLVGLLAVFTASLPWYCLIPTLAIPWATRLYPQGKNKPIWLRHLAKIT